MMTNRKLLVHKSNLSREQSGYSLLQMAMALLVFGVISVSIVQVYGLYKKQKDFILNEERVEMAVQKIQLYRQVFGTYPCPAPLTALRTDASYGRPSDCNNLLPAPIATGTCSGGICVQTTARDLNGDGDTLDPNENIRVRTGGIPFRELQMEEKATFDAYGSRLTYALTETMGRVGIAVDDTVGGIAIVDETNTSMVQPSGSASFIILSHGPNRIGAFNASTGLVQVACPTGSPAASGVGETGFLDAENCYNTAAIPTIPKFVNSLVSDGTGAFFDDTVQYFATAENKLWRRITDVGASSEDITALSPSGVGVGKFLSGLGGDALSVQQSAVNTTTGQILSANTTDPSASHGALEITGDGVRPLKSEFGQFCSFDNPNKCFQLQDFNSNVAVAPSIKCDANRGLYISGITSNNTNAVADCKGVRYQCPLGQVLMGQNPDGTPLCANLGLSCPSDTKNLCGIPTLLPASLSGYVHPLVSAGSCATATYTCNNGVWNTTGNTAAAYCTNAALAATACGAGYAGTFTPFACAGSNFAASCTCTGIPDFVTVNACSPPFTGGSQSVTCRQLCVANVLQPLNCDPAVGVCACASADYYEFADCGPGLQRVATPTPASFISPITNWPIDTKKGKYRLRTIDSSTCTYDNIAFDSSNCSCAGNEYTAIRKNPSDYPLVNADYVTNEHCYKSKPGNRDVLDGPTTVLTAVDYGFAVFKKVKNGACAVTSNSELDPATFIPRDYIWNTSDAPISIAANSKPAGSFELNSSCSCQLFAGAAAPSMCWKNSAVVGKFDIYRCQCLGS
jgi:type II secretory pathway pseudopilin PulG